MYMNVWKFKQMGDDVLADDLSKAAEDVAEDVEDGDALVGEAPTWSTST